MTDITTYPLEDGFETNLSQDWDGSVGTIYVNNTPSFTFPSGVTTYVIVDPGKSNMQLAEINAYSSSLKTITVSNITLDKGAGVSYTQQSHSISAVVRISHNYQFWKDMVDSINNKIDGNSADIEFGKFADATARDAYFTSPVNGNSAYLTTEGKWTDYVAGAWVDRASGTNPNASETVAGRVEIATQAEFDAGTATGGTGASVVATNDQIRKQINTATEKTTPVNADSIGIADSAASGVIKKTTLTEFKAASDMQATTTTSGFVELATDAEVATGTDETRYVNSKQVSFTIVPGSSLFESSNASANTSSASYVKLKDIEVSLGGTYTISFGMTESAASIGYGRIYVNGVAVGTEQSTTSATETTYTENITVVAGDNIQIYAKNAGGTTTTILNFRVYGGIKPYILTTTVIA